MNDSSPAVPEDFVRVREAAQAVGVTTTAVHRRISRGRLTVQSAPGVRRVSLAAVQALVAPPDPHTTPADAVAIYEALRLTDVTRRTIVAWVKKGWLPSWDGRHGLLVRVEDVRTLARQRRARLCRWGGHAAALRLPPN